MSMSDGRELEGVDLQRRIEPELRIRPHPPRRLAWGIGAAAVTLAILWLVGRWLDTDRALHLGPVLAASAIALPLSAAIRDPMGRLWLAVLMAVGVMGSAVLLDAPRFGILVALLVLIGPFSRATGAGAAIRRALRPVGRSWRENVSRPVGGWAQPRRRWVIPVAGVVIIFLFAILPFLNDWFDIPTWLAAATSGGTLSRLALFSLFALGLNVVVGFAGLLDLGYVAFWAIGSYTAAILTGAAAYTMDLREGLDVADPAWQGWMWLILLAALGVAVIAGILLGSPTLRLRGDYLAIVTLGFGEIIRIVANNWDSVTVGPRGITSIPHPEIHLLGLDIVWGTLIDPKYYWLLLVLVVLWVLAIRLLDNSRTGRAWVAVREDEV
ncbi:MAG: branched-chain amino acid ABC transporter permease, partial [Actinomycetota bacterium]